MKRIMPLILALLTVLTLIVGPVSADGIIIIDDPIDRPPDYIHPWLTVRYHRVNVTINDQIATTKIDQAFRNDSGRAVEGTYVFPIPKGAVVQHFTMWINGEPVEGKIMSADEARSIYLDYLRRNQDPALLEYIGNDAIKVRIFPIPAGDERHIQIEYTQILPVEANLLYYRYPLNTERFSAKPLEEVSISVDITSSSPLHAIYSSTHQDSISINRESDKHVTVGYEATNILPQQDFGLYIGLNEQEIGASLLTYHPSSEEGYFLAMLTPNFNTSNTKIVPKDIFIVLDTSGSMEGDKLSQTKEAAKFILRHLNPEDRFNIIAFNTSTEPYANSLQPVSAADAAVNWIAGMKAQGSTNIYQALSDAMAQADPNRPTVIIFLTDGLATAGITDDNVLLKTLAGETPPSVRLFSFGVGFDVNTLFLDQLSQDNRGISAYVTPQERIDENVSTFYAKIQSPLLTDISLDFGETVVYDVYPQPLPDLFAGTQLIVTGRYRGAEPTSIRLTGKVGDETKIYTYQGPFNSTSEPDFIPRLWAARKIGYLLTQIRLHGSDKELIDAVTELSLRYGIITPYTSFLVEEKALTLEGRTSASQDFLYVMPGAVSGEEAVNDAQLRRGYMSSEAAPTAGVYEYRQLGRGAGESPAEPGSFTYDNSPQMVYAGTKTFLRIGKTFTDTEFIPDQMHALEIGFGTPAYEKLAVEHPEWSAYLALGSHVTFVAADGSAYTIRPDGPDVQNLPPPAPTATPQPVFTIADSPTPVTDTPNATPAPGLCGSLLPLLLFAVGACLRGYFHR